MKTKTLVTLAGILAFSGDATLSRKKERKKERTIANFTDVIPT
jgi:hypothetical protein